jgi:hypothetical protein
MVHIQGRISACGHRTYRDRDGPNFGAYKRGAEPNTNFPDLATKPHGHQGMRRFMECYGRPNDAKGRSHSLPLFHIAPRTRISTPELKSICFP